MILIVRRDNTQNKWYVAPQGGKPYRTDKVYMSFARFTGQLVTRKQWRGKKGPRPHVGYVRGTELESWDSAVGGRPMKRVYFKDGKFQHQNGREVKEAELVKLDVDGKCWIV